jgi:hypothetical protein
MGNDENRSGLRLGNPLVAGSRLAPFFAAAAADWRATVLLAEPAANCQPVLRLACDHTLCAIMNDLHVCEPVAQQARRPRTIADRGDALPGLGGRFIIWPNLKCLCRLHHLLKTLWATNGWRDEQLPDGIVIWASPTLHGLCIFGRRDCHNGRRRVGVPVDGGAVDDTCPAAT